MASFSGISMFKRNINISKFIPLRAGEKYRLSNGKARSGNEDTAIHDFHDYHFIGSKYIF